jgi:transposase-like protein
MSLSHEVEVDTALERRSRRRFTALEKQRLLAESDALLHGNKGAWLRRQGLYAAQLSMWRRELAEHGAASLEPKPTGRKPADPRDQQIARLTRDNARLSKRIQVADALVDLQKKVMALVAQDESGSLS